MTRGLNLRGVVVKSQVGYPVVYKGRLLREYIADLVVEDKLLVELKCTSAALEDHMAQCLNYLKASGLELALIINFRKPKVEWKRIIYT